MTDLHELVTLRNGFDIDPGVRSRRDAGEVYRVRSPLGHEATLFGRYDDVRAVHNGAEWLRLDAVGPSPGLAAEGVGREEVMHRRAGWLLMLDPPEHTRLRRLLTATFTVRPGPGAGPADPGDRRRAPGRNGGRRSARRSGFRVRATGAFTGDLRLARGAIPRMLTLVPNASADPPPLRAIVTPVSRFHLDRHPSLVFHALDKAVSSALLDQRGLWAAGLCDGVVALHAIDADNVFAGTDPAPLIRYIFDAIVDKTDKMALPKPSLSAPHSWFGPRRLHCTALDDTDSAERFTARTVVGLCLNKDTDVMVISIPDIISGIHRPYEEIVEIVTSSPDRFLVVIEPKISAPSARPPPVATEDDNVVCIGPTSGLFGYQLWPWATPSHRRQLAARRGH
jgi:hypothetical protein